MVSVEIGTDSQDVVGAARVARKLQADVSNEVVEAFLTVQRGAGEGQAQVTTVLNSECQGGTDVADGGVRDGAKAGGVGPLCAPGSERPVGRSLPCIHPD